MQNTKSSTIWVVIPAAGVGSRIGADRPKQYLSIHHQTLLWHTIKALRQHPQLSPVMLAISKEDAYWSESDVAALDNVHVTIGGDCRAQSVLNGLMALSDCVDQDDWVLVHDACRPFVSLDELSRLIDTCEQSDIGGLLALPSSDTLKRVQDGRVIETIDRETIWRAQTPQMFRFGLLQDALYRSLEAGVAVTDEASAMEWAGYKPQVVVGRASNIKVTYPDELRFLSEEF